MDISVFLPLLSAALGGGVICLLAQLLIELFSLPPAKIMVLYVSLGVALYASGAYSYLLDMFGAGVSLPIIGFGASIARGVKDAVDSEGLIGAFSGGLEATAAGICLSLLLGLIFSLIFRSSSKRMSKGK